MFFTTRAQLLILLVVFNRGAHWTDTLPAILPREAPGAGVSKSLEAWFLMASKHCCMKDIHHEGAFKPSSLTG